MLTTVQDLGRWGFQANGVPVAGPMDEYSHVLANRIVGNLPSAAALEVTLIGPELAGGGRGDLRGCRRDLRVDGRGVDRSDARTVHASPRRPTEVWRAVGRRSRDPRGTGRARCAGRIRQPRDEPHQPHGTVRRPCTASGRCAASVTTLLTEPDQRTPRDSTAAARRRGEAPRRRWTAGAIVHDAGVRHALRVTIRYYAGVESDGLPARRGRRWRMRGARTSCRMRRRSGSLQVPGSGQPILLMADRQTTGGYPKIGVVIGADLPLAGQLAPGDWIEFVPCTREAAVDALKLRRRSLAGGTR